MKVKKCFYTPQYITNKWQEEKKEKRVNYVEIVFNIDGNYITNLAREWFYLEKKPYKKVEELLLSCMCGTSIDLRTLKKDM